MYDEHRHIPLSEYQVTFCSLMYPGPSIHLLKPSDSDGAADSASQFGPQAEVDWLCSRCSEVVCDVDGRRKVARPFNPPAKTPFWWRWCDACRTASKVESSSKKELKVIELGTQNKKMETYYSVEMTKDW